MAIGYMGDDGQVTTPTEEEEKISELDFYNPYKDPGLLEETKAAFRLYGPFVSAVTRETKSWEMPEPVEGYDALTKNMEDIKGFELHSDSFMYSKSPEETELIKKQILREYKDRQTLKAGGKSAWAVSMAAGIFDPISFALNFSAIGAVGKGTTAIRTALRTSASIAATEAIIEVGLHTSQETRTLDESMANIAGAAIFGGVLHGAWHGLTKPKAKVITDKIGKNIREETPELVSVRREDVTPEDYELVPTGIGIEKLPVSPEIRLMNSDGVEAKRFVQEALESGLVTKGHKKGITLTPEGGAVATRIKGWDQNLYSYLTDLESHYSTYRKSKKAAKNAQSDMTDDMGDMLTYRKFDEEVGKAAIRGDKHPIPEVEQAAQSLRKNIFDPLYNEAIALGMTKEEALKTAQSYFTRLYDVDKIKNNRTEWDGIIGNWLRQERVKAQQELPELLQTAGKELEEEIDITDLPKAVEAAKEKMDIRRQELESQYEYKVEDIKAYRKDIEIQKKQFQKLDKKLQIAKASERVLKSELKTVLTRYMDFRPDVNAEAYVKAVDKQRIKVNKLNIQIEKLEAAETALKKEAQTQLTSFFKSRKESTAQKNKTLATTFQRLERNLGKIRQEISDAQYLREGVLDDLKAAIGKSKNVKTGSKARAVELASSITRLQKKLRPKRDKLSGLAKETDDILSSMKAARESVSKKIEARRGIEAQLKSTKALARKLKGHELALIRDKELPGLINQITDHITGTSDFRIRLPFEAVKGKPSPLQARELLIPDEMIEGFLVKSSEKVATRYVKSMAPDIELTRRFGDFELKGVIEKVEKEYNALKEAAVSDKEIARIKKQQNRVTDDIKAVRDLIRGTYGMPSDPSSFWYRVGNVLRDVNYMTMLGRVVLASLPDAAMHVARNGLTSFARSLKAMAFDWKQFKMSADETQALAGAFDITLNGRAMTIADLADRSTAITTIEKGSAWLADNFTKVSLISHWNQAQKQFAGLTTADKILRDSLKWREGTLAKRDIVRLAQAGIDQGKAIRIANQFDEFGEPGSIYLSRGENWTDDVAFETMKAAVQKVVDATIITPHAAEMALWTRTPLGRVITQFKAFSASTHSKILVSGLQFRDRYALSGFLLSAALGYGSYALKNKLAGKETPTDPGTAFVAALDKSGTMGYFWDVNNIMGKVTAGGFSVNRMLGAPPMSKYAARNFWGTVLGPSAGTIEDVVRVGAATATGNFTTTELGMIKRLTPYNNLFYMSFLFDEFEKATAKTLKIKQPKKKRRRRGGSL